MFTCCRCTEYGLRFDRAYSPVQWLEGRASSRVWIVGLNPKGAPTCVDNRSEGDLRRYFDTRTKEHAYYRDFLKVSRRLYEWLGKDGGVAHTDLVKCCSLQWPPESANKDGQTIVTNCSEYLRQQLLASPVEMLVCNGAPVSYHIKTIVKARPESNGGTHYYGKLDGRRIAVVLSGFIGRIDDYAKRRLGQEIEALMDELGVCNRMS